MKEKQVLIYCRLGYLDGYDGVEFEWTQDRKTAWRLDIESAKRRIEQLKGKGITAVIQPL